MGIISTRLRNSAKGEACTICIPEICTHDPETTVLAHIRNDAKGMGNKADDWSAVFACHQCHSAIDQHMLPKSQELFYVLRAMQRTWARWIERGLIILPVDPATAKTRPKRKTKWPTRPIESRNTLRKDRP